MKIWCDVCDKKEASVFCCADEAALCNGCDRHVHLANKLAGKHVRFSLTSHSVKDAPLCDICVERRALLFCKEDRAILCRECEIRIHEANEQTKKHNRFLLTGVKISAYSVDNNSNYNSNSNSNSNSPSSHSTTTSNYYYGHEDKYHHHQIKSDSGSGSGCMGRGSSSSISEYLMETLPGWRVEDFLEHDEVHDHDHEDNNNNISNTTTTTTATNNESYRSSQYHHHHHHHQGFL